MYIWSLHVSPHCTLRHQHPLHTGRDDHTHCILGWRPSPHFTRGYQGSATALWRPWHVHCILRVDDSGSFQEERGGGRWPPPLSTAVYMYINKSVHMLG